MSRPDSTDRPVLSRRSLLGGALAAALLAAVGTAPTRATAPSGTPREPEKPRLPVWIGHI